MLRFILSIIATSSSLLLAVIALQPCPEVPSNGCSICGDGLCVSNLNAIFHLPGQPDVGCAFLQESGLKGELSDRKCRALEPMVEDHCGCHQGSPISTLSPVVLITDAPALETDAPVAETDAPIVETAAPAVLDIDTSTAFDTGASVEENNTPVQVEPVAAPIASVRSPVVVAAAPSPGLGIFPIISSAPVVPLTSAPVSTFPMASVPLTTVSEPVDTVGSPTAINGDDEILSSAGDCSLTTPCEDGFFCNYDNITEGFCEICPQSSMCDFLGLITQEGIDDCKSQCDGYEGGDDGLFGDDGIFGEGGDDDAVADVSPECADAFDKWFICLVTNADKCLIPGNKCELLLEMDNDTDLDFSSCNAIVSQLCEVGSCCASCADAGENFVECEAKSLPDCEGVQCGSVETPVAPSPTPGVGIFPIIPSVSVIPATPSAPTITPTDTLATAPFIGISDDDKAPESNEGTMEEEEINESGEGIEVEEEVDESGESMEEVVEEEEEETDESNEGIMKDDDEEINESDEGVDEEDNEVGESGESGESVEEEEEETDESNEGIMKDDDEEINESDEGVDEEDDEVNESDEGAAEEGKEVNESGEDTEEEEEEGADESDEGMVVEDEGEADESDEGVDEENDEVNESDEGAVVEEEEADESDEGAMEEGGESDSINDLVIQTVEKSIDSSSSSILLDPVFIGVTAGVVALLFISCVGILARKSSEKFIL